MAAFTFLVTLSRPKRFSSAGYAKHNLGAMNADVMTQLFRAMLQHLVGPHKGMRSLQTPHVQVVLRAGNHAMRTNLAIAGGWVLLTWFFLYVETNPSHSQLGRAGQLASGTPTGHEASSAVAAWGPRESRPNDPGAFRQ